MIESLRHWLKPKYETLNHLEISRSGLLDNYRYLKSLQPAAAMFPVLKSNAYGHGLKELCQILNTVAPPLVVVDSYPEAQIVYRHFRGKVLILGEMPLQAYGYCQLKRTEFVVYNAATLRHLARYGRKAQVHLFVNSGMNREGIQDLPLFLRENKKYLDQVQISGLMSHLAAAEQNSSLNQEQEENFNLALDNLRAAGYFPQWIHLGNSAAVFTSHNKSLTAFRPGLAFYGYSPFSGQDSEVALKAAALKPALEVYSQIIARQEIKSGASVSYNETYLAPSSTTIGVMPFGYFEGLDRRLSNQGRVLVKSAAGDFLCQIAGQVCMNLSCLDCGHNKFQLGDMVQVVSKRPADPNSIVNLALLTGTIPYEILIRFQANIRRKIV
ncbi:MAG: alanine racemase [Patescibacteria group bacterium]